MLIPFMCANKKPNLFCGTTRATAFSFQIKEQLWQLKITSGPARALSLFPIKLRICFDYWWSAGTMNMWMAPDQCSKTEVQSLLKNNIESRSLWLGFHLNSMQVSTSPLLPVFYSSLKCPPIKCNFWEMLDS
uniref:Uncharacterized protein n=1 Tax=Sphaerodactylus townsendi TaxID=933632 RepID=A0ACB8FB59_9SAUR